MSIPPRSSAWRVVAVLVLVAAGIAWALGFGGSLGPARPLRAPSHGAPEPRDAAGVEVDLPDPPAHPEPTRDPKLASDTQPAPVTPYQPWREPPPPLRAAQGLVRDAATRAPIQGAWITWRLPSAQLAELALGDPSLLGDPVFTMLSDAQGRFRVERLPDDAPLSGTLFVVARGYAYSSQVVGSRRELVFDLGPMGSLDVSGPPKAELRIRPSGLGPAELRPQTDAAGRAHVPYLPPGPCTVGLADGSAQTQVGIRAGQAEAVTLTPAAGQRVLGSLTRTGGAVAGATLSFVATDTYRRHVVRADALGRFDATLPAGRYAILWVDGNSERRVGELVTGAAQALSLSLDAPGSLQAELRLTRAGAPLESVELGLVALDAPLGSLIALDRAAPGVFRARLDPGRYALFEGPTYWGQVSLPNDAVELALEPQVATVAFELDTLQPEEVVRGELSLVPAVLSERPDLLARFQDATRVRFRVDRESSRVAIPVGAAGRYTLSGVTDLGPVSVEAELPTAELRVPYTR